MASRLIPNSETVDTSRYEFVQGKLIERAVPGYTHSSLQEKIAQLLRERVASTGKMVRAEFSLDQDESPRSEWLTPDVLVSTVAGFRLKPANDHALPPVFLAIGVLSSGQTFMTCAGKPISISIGARSTSGSWIPSRNLFLRSMAAIAAAVS